MPLPDRPPGLAQESAPGGRSGTGAQRKGWPQPGERVDDFELLEVLGAGTFATVYLARQVSLDRQVALKVSAETGSEARTLASLEHAHIVHVFAESVDVRRGLRLLSMQHVPGTDLEKVIRALGHWEPARWSGAAILEAVDRHSKHSALFDPASLRDREALSRFTFGEAVCWLGQCVAEALAHAHRQGVLHRDVKPSNILINRYGRPLLADFNIAHGPQRRHGSEAEMFGGTLAYMAPEHLDAFNPTEDTSPDAVDQRSDVYSLGVVLFELLTGRSPFGPPPNDTEMADALRALAAERRAGAPRLQVPVPVEESLERVVWRCLEPDPARRYQTAAELAQALAACRELQRIEQEMPAEGVFLRAARRHPFRTLLVLTFLPHVLGSAVNISYNRLRIVEGLTSEQRDLFGQMTLWYNLLVYPLCVAVVYRAFLPIVQTWRQLSDGGSLDPARAAEARRRVARLPLLVIWLSALGWLPGGVLFPLLLHLLEGPLPAEEFGHFVTSFTVSGLIALTYSFMAVELVVLRILYPRLLLGTDDPRRTARRELRPLRRRLQALPLLAGLIPLTGAVLLVSLAPDEAAPERYRVFHLLLTGLIVLGMAGFGAAVVVTRQLTLTLAALTGPRHAGP
jgi:serine/threonine protein kinase